MSGIKAAAKLGIPNLRIFAGTNAHESFCATRFLNVWQKSANADIRLPQIFGANMVLQQGVEKKFQPK